MIFGAFSTVSYRSANFSTVRYIAVRKSGEMSVCLVSLAAHASHVLEYSTLPHSTLCRVLYFTTKISRKI